MVAVLHDPPAVENVNAVGVADAQYQAPPAAIFSKMADRRRLPAAQLLTAVPRLPALADGYVNDAKVRNADTTTGSNSIASRRAPNPGAAAARIRGRVGSHCAASFASSGGGASGVGGRPAGPLAVPLPPRAPSAALDPARRASLPPGRHPLRESPRPFPRSGIPSLAAPACRARHPLAPAACPGRRARRLPQTPCLSITCSIYCCYVMLSM